MLSPSYLYILLGVTNDIKRGNANRLSAKVDKPMLAAEAGNRFHFASGHQYRFFNRSCEKLAILFDAYRRSKFGRLCRCVIAKGNAELNRYKQLLAALIVG